MQAQSTVSTPYKPKARYQDTVASSHRKTKDLIAGLLEQGRGHGHNTGPPYNTSHALYRPLDYRAQMLGDPHLARIRKELSCNTFQLPETELSLSSSPSMLEHLQYQERYFPVYTSALKSTIRVKAEKVTEADTATEAETATEHEKATEAEKASEAEKATEAEKTMEAERAAETKKATKAENRGRECHRG